MLLALPSAPPQGVDHPRAFAPSDQESLEEFLARARAKQAEVFARLNAELEGIVKRIEALTLPPPRQAREALIDECVALGSEATPLFVRWLDAGDASLEKERFRAAQIAQALQRMDTRPATTELLALAAKGPTDARVLAVKVLENSPEPERVRPELLAAFKTSEGQLRAALLRTLLRLASTDVGLLDEVLAGEDEALRNVALGVLTDTKNSAAEERVHKLLADPARSTAHAQQILMYYQALPELVTNVQLKELLVLAGTSRVPAATRAAIINALPSFVTSSSNELKKALDPIVTGADLSLAEAARIVMARLGDRAAKRDLLKPFDDLVESTPKWSQAYARRGDIERRIGEYRDAEKDYTKALTLGAAEASSQPDTYIGLAKCAALQGKFKDAKMWLEKAPINMTQLKSYANDPDFAKLRVSKFGDVFPAEGH